MKNSRGFEYKEYEIVAKEEIAPQTFLFSLKGQIKFNPGQFIQVALDHFGEATFAICSDPEQKETFNICIRAAGGMTNEIVKLSPGDILKIRGPYGNGWPVSKLIGKNIVMIAGGMGIVPLKPLLHNLAKYKSEFKRVSLVAGFKTDHHIIFKEDLEKLKKEIGDVEIIVEHASEDFTGSEGMITEGLQKIRLGKNTVVLMCGPEIMVPFCNKILLENKVPEENIYISFERRMECGIGVCQHCNIGKYLVCEDGPVFSFDKIKNEIGK